MRSLMLIGAFGLLAGLAWNLWRQQRSASTFWLAWMFTALATALAVAGLLPTEDTTLSVLAGRVARAALVAFPYLLFRFVAVFSSPTAGARQVADALSLAVIMITVLVPLPAPTEVAPAWLAPYLVSVVVMWTALTAWAVVRLWRAGRGQPAVAQRRMETLAVAAVSLNVALMLGAANRGVNTDLAIVAESIALGSALLFYIAVSAPGPLRRVWRRPDARKLRTAETDLMAAVTPAAVVSSVLPRVARLLGGDAAIFVHPDGTEVFHGEARRSDGLRQRALHDGHRNSFDETVVVSLVEGRLAVTASPYTPLFGKDEVETLEQFGTVIDLALSRARVFDAEHQAREQAEALSSELEALVYGISHDLRTPVVSVLGYLRCLDEDHADQLDDEGRHFLQRINFNAAYIDRLINDLLALSRAGAVPDDAGSVDLSQVATEIREDLGHQYPDATIHIRPTCPVIISPARARQLLTNLMANALTHGGRPDITIRIEDAPADTPGQTCIRVADNGRGIQAVDRERIFDIFQRSGSRQPSTGPGTGIGLAISRKIVDTAGGRIWLADTVPTAGTEIRVQLPCAPPALRHERTNGHDMETLA